MVVIRVLTDDPTPIAKAMHERGYTLIGPQDFEKDWT